MQIKRAHSLKNTVLLEGGTAGLLPTILGRSGPLPVVAGKDGLLLENGTIYVAPPGHHLLVEQGRLLLSRGPKENHHRPSVDALFRSAAVTYGTRVIGVILTGNLDDGTAGLLAVKQCGESRSYKSRKTRSIPVCRREGVVGGAQNVAGTYPFGSALE